MCKAMEEIKKLQDAVGDLFYNQEVIADKIDELEQQLQEYHLANLRRVYRDGKGTFESSVDIKLSTMNHYQGHLADQLSSLVESVREIEKRLETK